MKKSLILVGMLSIGYTYAQEGNVGINTENPKATLEIQPSATNLTGTTNEGIIIPKLTKARVAAIATGSLVEGTKVYVTDDVTAADTQFIGTGKGFYFYNGTKWVKQLASDNDTNSELWAQRDNAGVTETYLKPADTDGNKVYYSPKGVTNLFGTITENVTYETNGTISYKFDEIPSFTGINSSKFKKTNTMTNGNYLFSGDSYQLFGADAVNGKSYTGKSFSTIVNDDVSTNIGSFSGQNISVSHIGNSRASNLNGLNVYTFMGSVHNTNTPETGSNIAASFYPRILKGKANNLTGIWVRPYVYGGQVESIFGSNIRINTTDLLTGVTTTFPTMNYTQVVGYKVDIHNQTNTTVSNLIGADFFIGYENGSTAENGYNFLGRGHIKEGAIVNNYHGVVSSLRATGNANVQNVYGFKYNADFPNTFKPNNQYGLWIDNVNNGQTSNYSIYTNSGNVRFGDLKGTGDRVVYADENGVLKTGGSIASNNGVQTQSGMTCTAENAGKINYTTIQKDGKDVGVFGFCMQKGTDYVWAYMFGGSNIYGTSANGAAFGQGL